MKKFRKAIVALLAMAMTIGCFAVTAFAAEDPKYYVVGSMNGWDCAGAIEMTDAGSGIFTYTFDAADTTKVEFKIVTEQGNWDTQISMGGGKNGGNIEYTPEAAGKLTIKLDTAKIGENNEADEAVTVAPAGADAPAGVSAPVVAAVIAVVSMVGIVVFTKRRTVAE